MDSTDGLDAIKAMTDKIARLRAGEEEGYRANALPTAGQLLHRLHALPTAERLHLLEVLVAAGAEGHFCRLGLHAETLEDLRKQVMDSWSILGRIGRACRDTDDQGRIDARSVAELLPAGLRPQAAPAPVNSPGKPFAGSR